MTDDLSVVGQELAQPAPLDPPVAWKVYIARNTVGADRPHNAPPARTMEAPMHSTTEGGGTVDIDVFFDYTCPFSYRAHLWLRETEARSTWRPFSLLQLHKDSDTESVWRMPENADNISLLLLAGHELVRSEGGDVGHYLDRVFHAWHETGERLGLADVTRLAGEAGALADDAALREHFYDAEREHRQATGLGVFGTPTLCFGPERAVYVKLEAVPTTARALLVLDAVTTLSDLPSVIEIKRASTTD
ncbi:MAG: hypothetical protein Kow0010_10850 [Dehalococcoidia bacterium]